jgi:hypothetical protein
MNPDSSYRDRLFLRGHYVGESREPDGTWRRVTSGDDFRTVARTMRRWRQDRGHLMPETRVRIAREGDR